MRRVCAWKIVTLLSLLVSQPAVSPGAAPPGLRCQRLEIVLREDLNGLASIVDRTTGRQYAAGPDAPVGLYQLRLGSEPKQAQKLNSTDAVGRECRPIPGGLELHFSHKNPDLEVRCRVLADAAGPKIRWGIEIDNASDRPVVAVAYPQAAVPLSLGQGPEDDALVYPASEGSLLCQPGKRMRRGSALSCEYPGKCGCQFVYYFDAKGGLYMAAEDGEGHAKCLEIVRDDRCLRLGWTHRLPAETRPKLKLAYDVAWTCGDGDWQSGADLYRQWVERQPWCAKKLCERDVPDWLTHANVFLNFNVRAEGKFFPLEAAERSFARYRQFLGRPLVGVPFGWERHGAWIGPEYFPPFGGDAYYVQLSRGLAEHGDHLQVYTSGFRWGVRKPTSERRDVPRTYTDYDSTERFLAEGRPAAALGPEGSPILQKPAWADNYLLCPGSDKARKILAACFLKCFDWGVAGVDLDQNIGGSVPDCYSTEHGHAPGAGRWQFETMSRFLSDVRQQARAKHPQCFLGVEEPCEAYIPWLDCYHGRAFTDTHWPVTGPGAIAIPLYIYLFHEYQVGYAGWCDAGFSPNGDARIGLGRAFLLGMQPGMRVGGGAGQVNLDEARPQPELVLLRDITHLMEQTRDYLLLGRMLHDPKLEGAGTLAQSGKKDPRHPARPMAWSVVQASAWRSARGHVCYAVANLGGQPQEVRLRLSSYGMSGAKFQLRRVEARGQEPVAALDRLPQSLDLALKPWAVCCVEQTAAD